MELKGKSFIVTGGSSGLGEASARMLAGAGANALIADMNATQGEKVAAELGKSARFVPFDVTDESQVQRAVATCREAFGALHGAVNCARIRLGQRGLGRNGPHALASFARIININLVGTFNVIRLAAQAMAENPAQDSGERGVIINTASVAAFDVENPAQDSGERGVIINTASVAAFDGQIGQAGYSASKAAV